MTTMNEYLGECPNCHVHNLFFETQSSFSTNKQRNSDFTSMWSPGGSQYYLYACSLCHTHFRKSEITKAYEIPHGISVCYSYGENAGKISIFFDDFKLEELLLLLRNEFWESPEEELCFRYAAWEKSQINEEFYLQKEHIFQTEEKAMENMLKAQKKRREEWGVVSDDLAMSKGVKQKNYQRILELRTDFPLIIQLELARTHGHFDIALEKLTELRALDVNCTKQNGRTRYNVPVEDAYAVMYLDGTLLDLYEAKIHEGNTELFELWNSNKQR